MLSPAVSSFARREDLLARGYSPGRIAAAVRGGELIRVRRGWYCRPGVPFEQRAAIALGGRVGAVSAARSYGMWTGSDTAIHVSWGAHGNRAVAARRQLARLPVVSHWRLGEPGPDPWRESPIEAIRQTFRACDPVLAVAMADSACRLGLLSRAEVEAILDSVPARFRSLGLAIDGRTDSGLESIVRVWLIQAGLPFILHPDIHGLEVDFVIGQSLVLETDGRDFHTGGAFESDRRRDLVTGTHGYVTIRWSYRQIMEEPDACRARLAAAIRLGDHLRPVT